MRKRYLILLMFIFLIGCSACGVTQGECEQKIALKVSRDLRQDIIYVVCADGSGKTTYPLPDSLGDYPDWSPDGKWVTYKKLIKCNNNEMHTQIFVQNIKNGQEFQVSDSCNGAEHPHWSSDGNQIIFEGRGVEVVDVSCIHSDKECEFNPVTLAQEYSPTWHPDGDGESIVFEMYSETLINHRLMIVDVEEPEENIQLTTSETSKCCNPNWSPVENKIVAQCSANGEEFYIFEIKDGDYTFQPLNISGYYPAWSPDGSQIAYASIDADEGLGACIGGDCTKLSGCPD
jgi:Tol biopolymer transport system component